MKGNVRIGGALVVGMVVILVALYVSGDNAPYQEGSVIVSQAPVREYIESTDTDGDGVKDWEESLGGLITDTIQIGSSTGTGIEPYTPPETFTGKFSEALFQDYLTGKINGADMSDPTELVGKAVQAIEQNTQSKRHLRAELHTVDSTTDSIRAYGNGVVSALRSGGIKGSENEMVILQRALEKNDATELAPLGEIENAYTRVLNEALRMPIPTKFVTEHLTLLNALEAMRTDIASMKLAFTDPLLTLARVKTYEEDAKLLFNILKAIGKSLVENGASYTPDDPGAVFYMFDI